jgi:hypothetical protein
MSRSWPITTSKPGHHRRVKAITYATQAGDRAAAQYSHQEAALNYATAVRMLEATGSGDQDQHCRLLLALGDALSRSGDTPAQSGSFCRRRRSRRQPAGPTCTPKLPYATAVGSPGPAPAQIRRWCRC